jgi:putative MATE family efflux protein
LKGLIQLNAKTNKLPIQRTRAVHITLDDLPFGQPEDELTYSSKHREVLPKQVTSKMLYMDIVRIACPSLIELALTSLTSMADLIMVGSLGTWAISSVGLTTQPKFIMMTMVMAMNVGATALIAKAKGAGDQQGARLILRQALILNLLLAVIFSIIGFFTSAALISFMGAKDQQTLAGGTVYLQIQMASFVFFALTSTITAALRGIGDSRTAMYYNTVANLVNIILNYLLIGGNLGFPRMEVAGASLATAISQVAAFILAIWAISKKSNYLHTSLRDNFRPSLEEWKKIADIGLPAALEQLMMRVGTVIFSRTIASLGTLEFAAHQICMNIQSLTMMNGQAFSVSATSLMGQSLGKKRPDMARAYTSRCRRSGMTIAILLGISFVLFGRQLTSLYTNDKACIELCITTLWIVAFIQPFQSSQFIVAGALRGAGDTRFVAKLTFFTVMLLRPALAILAVNVLHWGLVGAWISITIDQMLRALLILLRYRSGNWKPVKKEA